MGKRALAEFIGTFWLVFAGCGAAVLASSYPSLGIGFTGVALAFGLSVLTMVYAVGPISGAHLNPAVSVGLTIAKRFSARDLPMYIMAQILGAISACAILFVIASGKAGFDVSAGFAANGFGVHSPGRYNLAAALFAEIVLTFFFVFTILGATDERAQFNKAIAGIPIGLALTLVNLVGIPVTNASVNPARSTGPAIFVGGWAIGQLWLFWVAPLIGAALAGVVYPALATARMGATPRAPYATPPIVHHPRHEAPAPIGVRPHDAH